LEENIMGQSSQGQKNVMQGGMVVSEEINFSKNQSLFGGKNHSQLAIVVANPPPLIKPKIDFIRKKKNKRKTLFLNHLSRAIMMSQGRVKKKRGRAQR
jgi:hypothetical protein